MTDQGYKVKYLKYNKMCVDLENKLLIKQMGGKGCDAEYYLKKFAKIEKDTKKKGTIFWFGEDGKLLSKANTFKESEKPILKKIKKGEDEWNGKILCRIDIKFIEDDVMDEKSGGIDVSVEVDRIYIKNGVLSIQQKEVKNCLLRLFYKYDELDNFTLSDMKNIALMMIDNKMKKVSSLKFYHYEDIEKYL